MKTYEFKTKLFSFYNSHMTAKFPELNGKIFRERLRQDMPQYPYVVVKTGERERINKRFEKFFQDGKEYIRGQYRIEIIFSAFALSENPAEAEKLSDDIIDYTEQLFIDDESSHYDLMAEGIGINELLSGKVVDLSSFASTNQEFHKETSIMFEFEDVSEFVPEEGKLLDINVECRQ